MKTRTGPLSAGFTLVEMLIAIVFSSIIFVSSYQVISNLIQYQVRARVQNDIQLDRLLVGNLISQIIEKSLHQLELYYRINQSSVFKGEPDSLRIISRAYSDNFDLPGYRAYRLYRHDDELHISYRAYDENFQKNQRYDMTTGLRVSQLSFHYWSGSQWLDEWPDEKSLPEFIRVTAEFDDAESQVWVRGTGRR